MFFGNAIILLKKGDAINIRWLKDLVLRKWLINSSTLYIMNDYSEAINLSLGQQLHQKANYFGQKEIQNQSEL